MSVDLYITEPPTSGKVIFHTDLGPLEVELWCKETPKACRNFIQLALEGFYDSTIFHRISPNFCVQGGDPSGSGMGGDSIYNGFFPCEFHSRLRFSRRGLLGMVAMNENQNLSQFFFTLDKAKDLKSTLFGKIVGDSIYNLIRISEIEVVDERPVYPPKLNRIEVLYHPFDDIIPRELKKAEPTIDKNTKLKSGKPKMKNLSLLSFGEEEEEIDSAIKEKGKSLYDYIDTKKDKQPKVADKPTKATAKEVVQQIEKPSQNQKAASVKEEPKSIEKSNSTASQIERLKKDIYKLDNSKESAASRKEEKLSELDKEKSKFLNGKRVLIGKRSGEKELDTLAMLNSFKRKLQKQEVAPIEEGKRDEKLCRLHSLPNCKTCITTTEEESSDVDDSGWISHQLKFDKEYGYKDSRDDPNELIVIDPRKKSKEILKSKGNK